MKRTIEIEDCLPNAVDSAISEVREELLRYLNENPDSDLPDLGNDLDYSGAIHEIVDGCVPSHRMRLVSPWVRSGKRL